MFRRDRFPKTEQFTVGGAPLPPPGKAPVAGMPPPPRPVGKGVVMYHFLIFDN